MHYDINEEKLLVMFFLLKTVKHFNIINKHLYTNTLFLTYLFIKSCGHEHVHTKSSEGHLTTFSHFHWFVFQFPLP